MTGETLDTVHGVPELDVFWIPGIAEIIPIKGLPIVYVLSPFMDTFL